LSKKAFFVAATGQHVGKTTTCLGLVSGLLKKHKNVGFIKPIGQEHVEIETGVHVDKDVVLFKDHFNLKQAEAAMSPVLFPRGFTRDFLDGKVKEKDPRRIFIQGTTCRVMRNTTDYLFPMTVGLSSPKGSPCVWPGGGGLHCGNGAHENTGMVHASWSHVPDFKRCNYAIYFGANKGSGSGHSAMITARLAAEARSRGMKFVVFDPMANFSGGKASEWIPILPGTDGAVCLAITNIIVNEIVGVDETYLALKTNAPYLIGPDGRYVRPKERRRPPSPYPAISTWARPRRWWGKMTRTNPSYGMLWKEKQRLMMIPLSRNTPFTGNMR